MTFKPKREFYFEVKNNIKCEAIHIIKEQSANCNIHRFKMTSVFQFDQKNPKDKIDAIARMMQSTTYKLKDIYSEMLKCNIFCCMHHEYRSMLQRIELSNNRYSGSRIQLNELERNGISMVINTSVSKQNKNIIKEIYGRYK